MLHFGDGYVAENVFHDGAVRACHLNVLPHVLYADLEFSGYGFVQEF
jgi:hypothetical protein